MSDRTSGHLQLAKATLSQSESSAPVSAEYDANMEAIDQAVSAGGGGTPGGADTQVQFNDGGAFGGIPNVTWDSNLGALVLNNAVLSAYFLATGGQAGSFNSENPVTLSGTPGSLPNNESIYSTTGMVGTGSGVWIAGYTVDSNYNSGSGSVARNDGVFIADQSGIGTDNNALHIGTQATPSATTFAIKVDGGQNDLGPQQTKVGQLLVTAPAVPASASAAGVAGTLAWDANFIYVCIATNTWKRTAITTW